MPQIKKGSRPTNMYLWSPKDEVVLVKQKLKKINSQASIKTVKLHPLKGSLAIKIQFVTVFPKEICLILKKMLLTLTLLACKTSILLEKD